MTWFHEVLNPHTYALCHIWIAVWTMTWLYSYWYLWQYLHSSDFTFNQELHMPCIGSITCHWVNIKLFDHAGGSATWARIYTTITYNDSTLDGYMKSCMTVYLDIFCEMISTPVTPHSLHWQFISESDHTITIVQNKLLRKTFVQNKGNSRGNL